MAAIHDLLQLSGSLFAFFADFGGVDFVSWFLGVIGLLGLSDLGFILGHG